MQNTLTWFIVFSIILYSSCNHKVTKKKWTGKDKVSIAKTFDSYIEARKNKNVERQVSFLYPEQFEYYPKDSIIYGFRQLQSFASAQVGSDTLLSISEVYEQKNIKYALVRYKQALTLDLSEMKGQGDSEFVIGMMLSKFKKDYGKENVIFDDEEYKAIVTLKNEMVAIHDPKYKTWKFLLKDTDTDTTIVKIIPSKIRNKLFTNPTKKDTTTNSK